MNKKIQNQHSVRDWKSLWQWSDAMEQIKEWTRIDHQAEGAESGRSCKSVRIPVRNSNSKSDCSL